MAKSATVRARIEPKTKAQAEKYLERVGLTTSDAIEQLMKQIVLHKGMPFVARVPNAETIKAMRELEAGKGDRYTGSTKNIFDQILAEDE